MLIYLKPVTDFRYDKTTNAAARETTFVRVRACARSFLTSLRLEIRS